ncbi:MAG: hypothetical protein H0W39_08605, partial [Sphingomonas sp.]|nr:hypothetical protein [Sphingomonas sp.]
MTSTAYPRSPRVTVRRKALMLSCAVAAMATAALAPQKALAQTAPPTGAFQGSISSHTGGVDRNPTSNISETITISSPTATINWTATSNNFLPNGSTATYTSQSGLLGYTVLNRVTPADALNPIELNGNVIATLEGSSTIGGNIWFYSPSGIVVGSTAHFDVGALLLSSLDIGEGWTADANGFSANFFQAGDSAGFIQILEGAQINALQQNSYVALIAPRIEQGGNVQVNGSAAYVAGEQLSMTMNQGLFDISVDFGSGTSDSNGVVHTGTTSGPASTGAGDNHRIYMAAVPKNQALTMLLSGNVGFGEAVSAEVQNGQIVLSAGWAPNETAEYGLSFSSWFDINTGGIEITGGNFSSDVRAIAQEGINATTSTGSLAFAGDVWFNTSGPIGLYAFEGAALTVGGNARLWSPGGAAGQVTISATSGGSVDIEGFAQLLSQGQFDGTSVRGGNIDIIADGGDVSVGYVQVDVGAWATDWDVEGNDGNAYAGTVSLVADNGGNLTLAGLNANASAVGGEAFGTSGQVGGTGYGGSVSLEANRGGTLTVQGSVSVHATGEGGTVSAGTGGTGRGGGAGILTHDSGSSIQIAGSVNLHSDGRGGDGQNGGEAYGGVTYIESFGGDIAVTGAIEMYALGFGGDANVGYGGSGGYGQGGVAAIEAHVIDGVAASVTGGEAHINTGAYGGTGGDGDGVEISAGSGGDAQGGLHNGERGSGGVHVIADSRGGVLSLGNVEIFTNAHGGEGGNGGAGQVGGSGGNATGGTVSAGTFNPDQTNTAALAEATFGNFTAFAGGYGGAGGAGNNGAEGGVQGAGGAGYGGGHCGQVNSCGGIIIGGRGTVEFSNARLLAHGWGGDGSVGGNGFGGDVTVLVLPDGSLASA